MEEHKRTGLIVFGVIWILLGLAQGGMSLTMIATATAGISGPDAPPARTLVFSALFYIAIGACFVTLGIGSIMAKRWARALILVSSWMWLIVGALSLVVVAGLMPKMLRTMLPPEQRSAVPFMVGCISVIFALFFVLLPGLAILFYRRAKVKAAVEYFDPVPRWTDMPLPLLGFALWLIFGAVSLALCALLYTSFPVGPLLLRGAAMYGLIAFFVAAQLFIGINSLKARPVAWWAAAAMSVIGLFWTIVLIPRTDFAGWYRQSGLATTPQQWEAMKTILSGPYLTGWCLIFWPAYLAFLFYLRRFFFRPNSVAVRK